MKITFWVFLIVGVVEIVANSFFLISLLRGQGFTIAKKFHGDFPSSASDRAWKNKIVASILLGVVALVASFLIRTRSGAQIIVSFIFAGGMLLMCFIEAVLYGKKHLPARISIIMGLVLVALVVFRV